MLAFVLYAVPLIFLLKILGFFKLNNFNGLGLYGVFFIKLAFAFILYHFPYATLNDSQIYLHDSCVLSEVLFRAPQDFFTLFFNFSQSENLDLVHMLDTNYWSHESAGLLSEKRNVIRVNAVFQILGLQNPYIVFLWNSLVSILGLKLLYQAVRKFTSDKYNLLFVAIFLLPSTLLWTSNISKESYLILGLGLFLQGLLSVDIRKNQIIFTASGLLILLMFKQYVAISLSFGLMLYILLQLKTQQSKVVVWPVCSLLFIVLGYFSLTPFTKLISQKQFDFIRLAEGGIILKDSGKSYKIDLDFENKLEFFMDEDKNQYAKIRQTVEATQENHGEKPKFIILEPSDKQWYVFVHNEASGSKIDITRIQNNSFQLLKNVPEALFNVLFRPLPSDPPKSLIKWYFVLENLVLWSIFIFGFSKFQSSANKRIIILLLVSSFVIALIIGWTTPVLGAIVRYKLPIVLSLIAVSWLLLFPKNTIIDNSKT